MSLAKWFLKNGPGSPGSTAKAFAKQYNKIPKFDHEKEWRKIYLTLCNQRIKASSLLANSSGCLYAKVDIEDVINFSEGCLAQFVFEMMYLETRQFRENIISNNDNFTLSTEIIHETIIDICPTAIKYKLSEFRQKAIKFINLING
jgi:hypothetical protein